MITRLGALMALGMLAVAASAEAKDSGTSASRPALVVDRRASSGVAAFRENHGREAGRDAKATHASGTSSSGSDHGHGTPDTETPAEETGCDGYSGAAYGWCTAACEAQDCGDPNQHSSDVACANLDGKFFDATGEHLPCLGGDTSGGGDPGDGDDGECDDDDDDHDGHDGDDDDHDGDDDECDDGDDGDHHDGDDDDHDGEDDHDDDGDHDCDDGGGEVDPHDGGGGEQTGCAAIGGVWADTSACADPLSEYQFACDVDGTIYYCDAGSWDAYGPSLDWCDPQDCGASCADFAVQNADGVWVGGQSAPDAQCDVQHGASEIACQFGDRFVWFCNIENGVDCVQQECRAPVAP